MNPKKMLIVVAAVALGIAGVVSSAQAGSKDDDERGGIKIGPLGQMFGGSPTGYAFASAPLARKQVRGKRALQNQRD